MIFAKTILMVCTLNPVSFLLSFQTVNDPQKEMVQEASSFFTPSSAKSKSEEDAIFLKQILKESHQYRHRAVTKIEAIGLMKEYMNQLTKKAALLYTVEQRWDSYIFYNRDDVILEFRQFAPSKIIEVASKASFEIPTLKRAGDQLKEWGRDLSESDNRVKDFTGGILETIGGWTGQDYTGAEAEQKIKDASGNYSGTVRPTLFSGLNYLLLYELGSDTPDKIRRVVLEGDTFRGWNPLSEKDATEEDVRQAGLLRTSYLVDTAILPDGKPAQKGDNWSVPANVFGDVMALRTDSRLQYIHGSLSFRRDASDTYLDGRKHAVLRLTGHPLENQIRIGTHPKQTKSDTTETSTIHFLPQQGNAFWDFEEAKISCMELMGKAEFKRGFEIDWGFDRELTVTPSFESLYESEVVQTNLLNHPNNRRIIRALIPEIRSFSAMIADALEENLGGMN